MKRKDHIGIIISLSVITVITIEIIKGILNLYPPYISTPLIMGIIFNLYWGLRVSSLYYHKKVNENGTKTQF